MTIGKVREMLAGVVFILVLVGLLVLSVAIYNKDFSDVVRVSVATGDIGTSLQKGSDVEARGVLIGSVTGVDTTGSGARIKLALDATKVHLLPADVKAELLPKTLFGERYVSLELPVQTGEAGGPTLHNGDVIQQDTSTQAVELQALFDNLLPVLQAVQPAQLASTLGEISAALRGRGAELGTTVRTITAYLRKLQPKIPEFDADIDKLASVADTYSTAAPELLQALSDLTTTSQTFVAEQQQLATLFQTVTTASNTVGTFLDTNSPNIITLSRDSLPTLQTLADYSSEYPCVSQALAAFVPVANKAMGVGTKQPGLHVILNVVPSRGKYVAGLDAPSTVTTGGPSCPIVSSGGLADTAVGSALSSGSAHATSSSASSSTAPKTSTASALTAGATSTGDGIGEVNSPQENQFISELMAPTMGIAPSAFPAWGSLLLGPLLRGTEVTVK